ncbi:hypothetical protein BH11BAC3_BH11BAC3_47740 [soil metagenome]
MFIISDKPGQLCNQLWSYTNIIAIARECKVKVVIILGEEYFEMFNVVKIATGNIIIIKEKSVCAKILRWVAHFARNKEKMKPMFSALKLFNIRFIYGYVEEEKLKTKYKKRGLNFILSWHQRNNHNFFYNNRLFIQKLVSPTINIKQEVDECMQSLKQAYGIIVGVHLRKGDYINFKEGRYFFSDATYLSYMIQMSALLKNNNILFYLFSNEKIIKLNFKGVSIFCKDNQPASGDLWAMSQCNYIMGPPSTFSMWASFWQQCPLRFLENENELLSLDQFKTVVAQNIFR